MAASHDQHMTSHVIKYANEYDNQWPIRCLLKTEREMHSLENGGCLTASLLSVIILSQMPENRQRTIKILIFMFFFVILLAVEQF